MGDASIRSAQEVFDDHLREGKAGSVEDDLPRNYAEHVTLLTGHGIYRGYEGVRYLAQLLREELPNATFEYQTTLVDGEMAFLEWTAHSDIAQVADGADSFLIRNGRIVVQTIHYTVKPLSE